ncbi:hypothetical protein TNCV_3340111 [Trichonephila clavipes]|nr:hypothetical protein TNCV_3340111 [Trichonephila clavipes]
MWIGLRSQSHLRFGFDSDSRPSSSALPLQAPTGEGKGPVAGSRCQSIIVLVVGIFDSYYLCRCRGRVCVCDKMEDKEASNSKETQTKKARRVCHYNVDWKLRFVWLNKCDEDNRKGY